MSREIDDEFEDDDEEDCNNWSTRCFLLDSILNCINEGEDSPIDENSIGSGTPGYCANEDCFINVIARGATVASIEREKRNSKNKCKKSVYRMIGDVTFELTSRYCGHEQCKCDELEAYVISSMTKHFGSCFEVQNITWEVLDGSHDNVSIARTIIKTTFGFTNKIK